MDKDELIVNFVIIITTIIASSVLAFHNVSNWGGLTVASIIMLIAINCFMKS